jgi:hypothetical protein
MSLRKFTLSRSLSTLVSILRNKKKLVSLNRYPNGSFFIKPYIHGSSLGQVNFTSNLPSNFWPNNLPGSYVLLKFLSKYSICSNVFIGFNKKYALSNGTFCQILDFFQDFNLVKVVLPSRQVMFISGWNFAISGKNSLSDFKNTFLGKAGYKELSGKKPKVRGVARNPVDHPHGGRTKTNQPEVSIWGWVAKRNK